MDAIDEKILKSYMSLLNHLSTKMKLNLIEKLNNSIKSKKETTSKFKASFGAWDSKESADELIELIRDSRKTQREIEEL